MPAETYHGVGSSPAKVQKPHTRDPTRQGLDDQRNAEEERDDMMEDCILTAILMSPQQFQEYVPVPADFDIVFPPEKIQEIAEAFQHGFDTTKRSCRADDDAEDKVPGMLPPLERDISNLWVRLSS